MRQEFQIAIYGDSLMRATVPDKNFRYRFTFPEYEQEIVLHYPVTFLNRARFGATVKKGRELLKRDLARGELSGIVLLEYGGNDCNHNWADVAQKPDQPHLPAVERDVFCQNLLEMAQAVRQAGATPVLMSLPPIHSRRFLDFVCRDGLSRENILHWLGDQEMIYRYQEMYSGSITNLAAEYGFPCIDVREAFLQRHDLENLISADGMHLTAQGYHLMFQSLFPSLESLAQVPQAS